MKDQRGRHAVADIDVAHCIDTSAGLLQRRDQRLALFGCERDASDVLGILDHLFSDRFLISSLLSDGPLKGERTDAKARSDGEERHDGSVNRLTYGSIHQRVGERILTFSGLNFDARYSRVDLLHLLSSTFLTMESIMRILSLVTVTLLSLVAQAKPLAGSKPNILLIMSDDQGYGDLGCTWQSRH